MRLDPAIPANTYHDSFGNFCHVIRAPAGRLTMSTDFLMKTMANQTLSPRRPSSRLWKICRWRFLSICLAAATARPIALSDIARSLFGQVRKGWTLVKAICDFVHDRITFSYRTPARPKRRWTPTRNSGAYVGTLPILR